MTVPTRAQRIASITKHTTAIVELTAQSSTTDEKLQEIDNRLAYLRSEFQPKPDTSPGNAASLREKKKKKKKKGGGAGTAASGWALENAVREVKGRREDGGYEKEGEKGKKEKRRRKKRMTGKEKRQSQR
ncbi:hypothetical protein LZ554_009230 [Drepanopeziza brunnea f. sp. 'monogermtubi']|nr:hypothetical protein LZ554_009230 [Drepanopeziza brunnea f. sp. 'monogermtubi']